MKVRNGFVSNSSSCSFTIYGYCLSDEDFKMIKDRMGVKDLGEALDMLDDKIEGLGVHYGQECEYGSYVGRSWEGVKDDETGAQFKKDVEEKVEKFLGRKEKCYTCTEAWYDG